jgi:anaerobic selenocysteine-containing dehydrogenase
MDLRRQAWLVFLAALCVGCASTDATQGEPEEALARAFYDEHVQPLLESQCAQPTCHGVPDGEDHADLFGGRFLGLPIDAEGRVAGADRADRAYASAKLFINPYEADARYSSLVRKAVAREQIGYGLEDGFKFVDDEVEALDFEAFAAYVAEYTPEVVERISGVPAERLVALADLYGNPDVGVVSLPG